ncbi:hypothetical protein AB7M73_010603 [Bradyrhizobium japonicum]
MTCGQSTSSSAAGWPGAGAGLGWAGSSDLPPNRLLKRSLRDWAATGETAASATDNASAIPVPRRNAFRDDRSFFTINAHTP